uniref:Spermatogenesis-defective protein 39 homolog n=1 Tax=Esox lucius TaxID=8010 RepID=A0A3P8XNT9_ESOLU
MIRGKPDDDEYWNSSKFKAFTFDDEDDDFTRLKESKRAVNSILVEDEDEEDEVEKVNWSGEPVGSISWSVKETASNIRSTGEVRDLSFPKIDTAPSLPKNSSGYSLSSLFKGKTCDRFWRPLSLLLALLILYFLHCVIPWSINADVMLWQDYISDWTPEETVKRMQQGKAYSLEKFHFLQDKLLLLDEAVNAHDGNVITAVLIFLKKSLSKEILFRELIAREIALRHYIHYLKEMGEHKHLVELFNLPFSQEDATHVLDHYTLLERQIIIEANDKHVESSSQADIFKKYPRKASILNMPIITTLYYSCFYHYGESEGTYSSPANIRKTFRISDKQFLLTCLGARAKLKAWFDVDALFTTKNWLGYTKKRSPIGFHRIVDILHKNNAPVQVLQEYVNLVEDTEQKISLAQKYKCHDVIINTYRDLKDRQLLIGYREKVERSSPEYRKIEELLFRWYQVRKGKTLRAWLRGKGVARALTVPKICPHGNNLAVG